MREPNPDQRALHLYLEDARQLPSFSSNPMAAALGTRLVALDGRTGTITLEFAPDAIFVQGAGVLQGGAVSAMLDFAMAFAVLALLPAGQACTTTNANVSFLRAAPRGRYVAVGEIERRGRQLAFTRARLMAADLPERVVATATSTLLIMA